MFIKVSNITGPHAPHLLKFVRRADIGVPLTQAGHHVSAELGVEVDDFTDMAKSAEDVMMVVKHWMSDVRPQQIIAMVPACYVGSLCPTQRPCIEAAEGS